MILPKWLLLFAVALPVGSAVQAETETSTLDTNAPVWTAGAEAPASASNLWFDVGEEIHYDIYWGIIHVGSSIVTTEWVYDADGRTRLLIRFKTRTNKVVEQLYPVEDLQETMIDPDGFLPVYYYKKSRQGGHHDHELTTFDHAAGKAVFQNFLRNYTLDIPIDPDTRDLICLMYYIRSTNFEVGQKMEMKVLTDKKVYDLLVNVEKKTRLDVGGYGRVANYQMVPEASFNGLFIRKGKVTLWVSADPRQLCTQIAAKVPVASIRIKLDKVLGPGQDFWVGKAKKGSPEVTPIPRE